MPNLNLKARKTLKRTKLYCTEHRAAILKVLSKANRPLSQNQIARRLRKTGIDKVTIYRTLQSFCRTGLVHKAYIHKRAWHFELAHNCTETQCHPHFTCTNCGQTSCLTGISPPMTKSPRKGLVIKHQRIQLEGLCLKCNPKL